MGKIKSNFFTSVDGVVEAPEKWHFPYFSDELGAAMGIVTQSAAFLMGRVLYNEWAAYWPEQGDEVPFASFINNVPKFVVSNTLDEATWNNTTIVSGDVAAKVRELKEQTDGDIGMSGCATTVRWLLANGLLDELHLFVHPIVVGHGHRLFEDETTYPLTLVNSETYSSGTLSLTYAPAEG